jgi:hypothetical protein
MSNISSGIKNLCVQKTRLVIIFLFWSQTCDNLIRKDVLNCYFVSDCFISEL